MPTRVIALTLLVALACSPGPPPPEYGVMVFSTPLPSRTGEQMAQELWERYSRILGPDRLAQASLEIRPTSKGWMVIIHDVNATCSELGVIGCRHNMINRDVLTCTSGLTLGASARSIGPDEYFTCGGPRSISDIPP